MAAEILKTYDGMGWISGLYDNPHPLRLDVYSLCSFRCLYCNASFRKACSVHKSKYLNRELRSVDPAAIRDLYTEPKGPFRRWIEQRREIQIGGLADPFDGFERVFGITLELLRFFREIDLPILFSTKSAWWVHDPRYAELFANNPRWRVRFSFGALDDELAGELEPGAAPPSEKLRAMTQLSKIGGVPVCRLRPFIPGTRIFRELLLFLKKVRMTGAGVVESRLLELDGDSRPFRESIPKIVSMTGMPPVYSLYPTGGRKGWERAFSIRRKALMSKVREGCQYEGLKFSTSDRAADFDDAKTFLEKWRSGRDAPVFHATWRDAAGIALTYGRVEFADLLPELESVFGDCRASLWDKRSRSLTMIEYFRQLWNSPTDGCSPETLYPRFLEATGAQDDAGNVVYFGTNSV